MPGILGIIASGSRRQAERRATLECMVKCTMNEPFYDSGIYVDEGLGLYSGWTCLESPFSGSLPIWNENRDICLILSGEEFSDRQDIDGLRGRGHQFDQAHAAWIVHHYEEVGGEFVKKANGWFSGLLVDLRRKRIFLFNDRYGLTRIYYHEHPNGFYFASEAKSILKVLPETRELDMASLGEFYSVGCALQNRTLFAKISQLPAGSNWEFVPGERVRKNSYFDRGTWEKLAPLAPEAYYEQLKETFSRVLRRYLSKSKKIGVSLTGGVDSRMIMAWAHATPGFLPCYTFGGKYRHSIDVAVARQVAGICQQPHEVIPVGREFLSEFSSLAEKTVYLTDGAMDVSGAADLFVNRVARQIAPVRMTGNYGGEILRELVAFKPQTLHPDLFAPELSVHVQAAGRTYATELEGSRLSFVAFKQVPWHHFSRLSLERSQIVIRSPYLDNEIVELAYRTPPELARSNEPALRLIAEGNAALGQIGTDRGVLPRPIPVLTKLRHLYQEFTFKAEYAYDYGMPHAVAKIDAALAAFHLERCFLGRHKFHHFRIWYRDELSAYLKAVLLDSRTLGRSYLRGKNLEGMVRDHIKGVRNYTTEFHRVLTIELLQRQLIEKQ